MLVYFFITSTVELKKGLKACQTLLFKSFNICHRNMKNKIFKWLLQRSNHFHSFTSGHKFCMKMLLFVWKNKFIILIQVLSTLQTSITFFLNMVHWLQLQLSSGPFKSNKCCWLKKTLESLICTKERLLLWRHMIILPLK